MAMGVEYSEADQPAQSEYIEVCNQQLPFIQSYISNLVITKHLVELV